MSGRFALVNSTRLGSGSVPSFSRVRNTVAPTSFSSFARSFLVIWRTTSFSSRLPGPFAPSCEPPCPASMTMRGPRSPASEEVASNSSERETDGAERHAAPDATEGRALG